MMDPPHPLLAAQIPLSPNLLPIAFFPTHLCHFPSRGIIPASWKKEDPPHPDPLVTTPPTVFLSNLLDCFFGLSRYSRPLRDQLYACVVDEDEIDFTSTPHNFFSKDCKEAVYYKVTHLQTPLLRVRVPPLFCVGTTKRAFYFLSPRGDLHFRSASFTYPFHSSRFC